MIQKESKLLLADNSGALRTKCIYIKHKSINKQIGNTLLMSILKTNPGKSVNVKAKSKTKIKRKQKVNGLIVQSKSNFLRKDGSYISFNKNRVIIYDNNPKIKKKWNILNKQPLITKFRTTNILPREVINVGIVV